MDGVDDFARRARIVTAWVIVPLVIAVSLKAWLYPPPPIPISLANGRYTSSCCGTIVLNNGQMTFGQTTIPYHLLVIKADLLLEVDGDIAVRSNGAIVFKPGEQQRAASFWRYPYRPTGFDHYDARSKPPDRLTLWSEDYQTPYDFAIAS